MSHHCYFEGTFHSVDTPLLKTNDLGLLRGYGVFDYLRTYNGLPFRYEDYWERFNNSANSLGLELFLNSVEVLEILNRLYRLSGESDVAFRLLLTGGYAPDGMTVTKPNFMVRSEPLPRDNPEGRESGIKVIPYEYVRDLPYIKSTSYTHMIMMAPELREQAATDLLCHKDGLVSELTRSNIFIVKGEKLFTPDKDALRGITRKLVIEKAEGRYEVARTAVSLAELLDADEVFTTSTTKGAMPVVAVGDRKIGTGKPGPVSLEIQALLEDEFNRNGR